MVPKLQNALFKMKIRTKRYSGLVIPNSTTFFINSVHKTPFLGKFVPKLQSALFRMKLITKKYSGVRILILTIF